MLNVKQAKDDRARNEEADLDGRWTRFVHCAAPIAAPSDPLAEEICGADQEVRFVSAKLAKDEMTMLRDLLADEWGVEELAKRWNMRRTRMRDWIDDALWRVSDAYGDLDGQEAAETGVAA